CGYCPAPDSCFARPPAPSLCSGSAGHRDLPSFPTRRSSDLYALLVHRAGVDRAAQGGVARWMGVSEFIPLLCDFGEYVALAAQQDRKSTRLNSSHVKISYAVFCLKKKKSSKESLATRRRAAP